jgi:deoxyribodipyrimidine photo-lyase
MTKSLVIFRRDLRLEDNTALNAALKSSDDVIPCFIFDPAQVERNEYLSSNALQFMINSLKDLGEQLKENGGKLHLFYGKPAEVIELILKQEKVESVHTNRDYTPFSRRRDDAIRKVCERNGAAFRQHADALLNEPEAVLKEDGRPYSVFTPYLRKARTLKIRKPQKNTKKNYYVGEMPAGEDESVYIRVLKKENPQMRVSGGRSEAELILSSLSRYEDYGTERDYPALDTTTHLSAHNKFGTCSIREAYHTVGERLGFDHQLIRQLYWRDFFTYIGHHFPQVFGRSFKEKYDKIPWSYDKKNFRAWCEGKTGYPIVDAGMRELNETGFMHNRVRMISASFLTKDLHIDWRLGEKYFAQKLVDYDPAVNNGNWQWAASTGCDAQPYFRIFNPLLQQRRYDPDCEYIKKWVPELAEITAEEIHDPTRKRPHALSYPQQIVDHKTESRRTKAMFSEVD